MRVAVVGLGIMGSSMATRLLGQGHQVGVYNRTQDKAKAALDAGGEWHKSAADAARWAELLITFVTDSDALEAIAFGDRGILAGIGPDTVHCDMSTIAPAAAVSIAAEYRSRARRYVQSPVLGSWRQILEGSLLIFGGGDSADIDHCVPVWDSCARQTWRFDTVEQSAATKLSCNILIAQMIVGLGQTMALAATSGVDPKTVLEIVNASNLGSAMYASKGKTIVENNFTPNFIVKNMLKDLRLASDYALDKALPLPGNAANREQFIRAVAEGFGEEDYSAVVKTLLPKHRR